MRDLFSMIPEDWGAKDEVGKINWYNTNQVTPDELLATGVVSQDTINTMLGRGYLGTYAPPPVLSSAPSPLRSSTYNTLATEQELDDPYAASEQDLLNIVGGTPPAVAAPAVAAPAVAAPAAPAPFNPAGFDWSQGTQNIGGTIYQPEFDSTGSGDSFQQGPLQRVLRYQEGQTGPGQAYEILNPATGQVTGTGKFQEVGNAGDLIKSAATDLAPLATFALGVGPLGGMLGSTVAGALGIPVATATSAGLTAAQVAALGSAAGSAGLTALQGGSFEDVLKSAVPGALSGFVNPIISETVGNIFPDQITGIASLDDALVKGAQSLATTATKAAVTGQDIDVIQTLMPAIAGGISDEFGVDYKTALTGLTVAEKLISGDDLGFKDIIGIAQLLPGATPATTKPSAGQTASAGYGGAETEGFFDSEEAQAVEDDIQSILARYPEAAPAPFFPEFEEPLLTAEPPAQQVEITAPASAPTIEDFIDQIAREEAVYALPETPQQIPVTGEKEAALPDLPEPPTPQDVLADVESVLARYPAGQTVTTTGQKEAAPTLQDFIDQITREEDVYVLPEPEQRYEVTAPAPQPIPISELERILFEEANIMPEPEQRYEVTAPIPAPHFPEFEEPFLDSVPEPEQRYEVVAPIPAPYFPEFEEPLLTTEPPTQQVEVKQTLPITEAPVLDIPVEVVEPPALPPEQVVEVTGTKPEAPIIPLDDIPEIVFPEIVEPPLPPPPPDQVIDVTGTKRPEINVPALEDVPEVVAPPVVAPTIPATTPTTKPTTTPATTPATTPLKPPARPTYDALLLFLLGMAGTPQQQREAAQKLVDMPDSPFGSLLDEQPTTEDDLLRILRG